MAEGKGLGSCIKTEDREIRSLFLQWSNRRLDMERTDGTLYEACTHQQTSSWPRLGFLAFKFDFDPPPYRTQVPCPQLALHTHLSWQNKRQAGSLWRRRLSAAPLESSPGCPLRTAAGFGS